MPFFLFSRRRKNRERISKIRDEAPTHVEALARLFTDSQILDDGTLLGRVQAILEATEHRFVPGLHTGILFGQNGFREEFLDPWQASSNQVGHFLTAVRLAFDPKFLSNPALFFLLNSWQHKNIPVRLIVGHEKAAACGTLSGCNTRPPQQKTSRTFWPESWT
jgi:hypothetical protein